MVAPQQGTAGIGSTPGGNAAAAAQQFKALDAAWRSSFLSEFTAESQAEMRSAGMVCFRDAGQAFPASHVALILSGNVGVETRFGDRTLMLDSLRVGDICGIAEVLGKLESERRAITSSHAFLIPGAVFASHARRNVHNALATARAVSYVQEEMVVMVADHVMLPMRSRVGRFLVDFAEREGVLATPATIRISPSAVAREIGTVPAVVVRTFAELEREGLIERRGTSTVILHHLEALTQLERGTR